MKKLFISCCSLQSGGAERVLSILSSEFANNFDEVHYVMWYNQPVFYEIDSRVKIISIEKEVKTKSRFKQMRWFRTYVKEQNPDIILSFSAPFNMLTIASLLLLKVKIIAAERVDPRSFHWGKHLEILRNLLYRKTKGILAQTEYSKNYFTGTLLEKTSVIYNPVIMSSDMVGAALKTPKKNLIVSAARLEKQKRQDLLLEVFADFLKVHPNYELVIYGKGSQLDNLISLAEKLNISENVKFPGSVKKLWDRMLPAKIFILNSLFEGMSNSMIESLCLGIPTISTKVSGATDLIQNGQNGVLVDIDDKEAILTAMLQIVENHNYACQLGEKGMQIYNQLRVETISKQWIDYLNKQIDC